MTGLMCHCCRHRRTSNVASFEKRSWLDSVRANVLYSRVRIILNQTSSPYNRVSTALFDDHHPTTYRSALWHEYACLLGLPSAPRLRQRTTRCTTPSRLRRPLRAPRKRSWGSVGDLEAHGESQRAMPALSVEEERFGVMVSSHADNANGTSTQRLVLTASRHRESYHRGSKCRREEHLGLADH